MNPSTEALLFLDLDKSKDPDAEARFGRLRSDPRLKAGWFQYQALRALALESAPSPNEKMLRAVLTQCRRETVSRQLSQITGGDELAREILLGKGPKNHNPAAWILGLLLLGTLGLGWMAFKADWLHSPAGKPETAAPSASLLGHEEPVPFEFPVQSPPADAALAGPGDKPSDADADDVHDESPASRQAGRLLREHLHEAQERDEEPAAAAPAPASPQGTELPPDTDAMPATEEDPKFSDAEAPASIAAPSSAPAKDTDNLAQAGLGLSAGLVPASAAAAPLSASAATQTPAKPKRKAPPKKRAHPRAAKAAAGPAPVLQAAPSAASPAASAGAITPAAQIQPGSSAVGGQTPAIEAAPTPSSGAGPAGSSSVDAGAGASAPSPTAGTQALSAGLTLSANTLMAAPIASATPTADGSGDGESVDVAVTMPQQKDIDVRLFSATGRPVRSLASGAYGPGTTHFILDAKDDQGRILAPGTYYLRVMTPWFSRVEAIQIH